MNKKEELIPIGIASSVAKTSGFDWIETIEIADRLDVSAIQLHFNQYNPDIHRQKNLTGRFDQIYIHLPAVFKYSHPFFKSINDVSKKPILIQHERYVRNEDIKYFVEHPLVLGFENDQQNNLYGSFEQLQKLYSIGLNLSAVIDLPRFFHQFHDKHEEKEIYNHILNILSWCKTGKIPVIIHTIDIADYQPDHASWVPIFEGTLPWKNVLSYLIEESIPVKSIIFEYEDVPNTEKSVYSLRKWFSNKHWTLKYTE